MKEENRIDLSKVKNVYDIAGSWIWRFGYYQDQYVWDRTTYKNPVLVNKNTGETIKGFSNIMKYIIMNNLELERFM